MLILACAGTFAIGLASNPERFFINEEKQTDRF